MKGAQPLDKPLFGRGQYPLAKLLPWEIAVVAARVSAAVAGAGFQLICQPTSQPQLIERILYAEHGTEAEGTLNHAPPVMPPQRPPHVLHELASVREHTPIGVLPAYGTEAVCWSSTISLEWDPPGSFGRNQKEPRHSSAWLCLVHRLRAIHSGGSASPRSQAMCRRWRSLQPSA